MSKNLEINTLPSNGSSWQNQWAYNLSPPLSKLCLIFFLKLQQLDNKIHTADLVRSPFYISILSLMGWTLMSEPGFKEVWSITLFTIKKGHWCSSRACRSGMEISSQSGSSRSADCLSIQKKDSTSYLHSGLQCKKFIFWKLKKWKSFPFPLN